MSANRKINKLQKSVLLLIIICFLAIATDGYSAERQKLSLNGTWDFKWDNENHLSYPPEDKDWTPIELKILSEYVTGFGIEGTNHWAWYRRKVRVPESMKGQRIKVRFSAVKYKAYVYWNGVKVGEHSDGYIPFEIDITDHVDFKSENELLVGVIDRLALQRPDVLPYTRYEFGAREEKALFSPVETLLGPVYRTERTIGGIYDNVDLVSYPEVYVEDFHITTSVRRSDIMVDVDVLNEGIQSKNIKATVTIEDNGKVISEFPGQSSVIPAGKNVKFALNKTWQDPHLWSHEDPYLYTIVFRLFDQDKVIDEKKFKFGFREFWIEGTDFYLNGRLFKIRRNHFNFGSSYEDARKYMSTLKSLNINQIRLLHRAAPEWILDIADEIGMTVCPGSAFFSRAAWYDVDNPKMWENAKVHWSGIIKSAKNHPSVLMYSIENEMHSTGAFMIRTDPEKWDRYQDNWIELGKFVRNLDPTKPLQYSWGKDVHGWSEISNVHYQRDIKYFFQYPNDLYWNEHENFTEKEGFGYDGNWSKSYMWKKDKPFIIGEFGYWYHSNPPHGLTPFIGDEAYVGNKWYDAWYWCMDQKYKAYKYSGITANPWIYSKDRGKIFPLAEVFFKDWQSNYYSGEILRKEIVVLNEDYFPKSMKLKIKLANENKTYYKKTISLDLKEGEKWVKELIFKLPDIDKRVNTDLEMTLVKNGKELYKNSNPIHIFPKTEPIKYDETKIGLYDPHGKTKRELISSGFKYSRIDKIGQSELSDLNVLIIGKDAVDLQFRSNAKILNEFVKQGGRAIFLEQTIVKTLDWLPFKLDIDKNHSSTVAFRAAQDHTILKQIEKNDLRYWRGNHRVSKYNFIRPKFWNYSTVSYTGGEKGIEHTPLVTLRYGEGLFTFTQFIISDEMSKEPVAFLLFNNMLKYSIDYSPSFGKAAIIADKHSSLLKTLRIFGAEVENIKNISSSVLTDYNVLFIDNTIDLKGYETKLEKYLENGGRIVLRELTPDNISNSQNLLSDDISVEPIPEIKYLLKEEYLNNLPVSYVPILNKMNAYPLLLGEQPKVTDLIVPTSGNKVIYPLNWEGEPEMSALLCPTRAYKADYNPLLAGISNFDLYWRTETKYLAVFGLEIAPIARFVVTGDKMIPLTIPAVMAIIQRGKGHIIIDQIDWETGLKKISDKTCRIISNFLNNLNIRMKPNNQP